jgi:hypothetical protein
MKVFSQCDVSREHSNWQEEREDLMEESSHVD